MAGSVNKVTLIGNLGADPDIRTMQSGDKVVNLSLATTESWKDKSSGERRDKTEWHRIVIFNQGLVNVCENYLRKGAKIYIEGQLETRSWEQDGQKKYTTEVVLRPYRGELTMLDSRNSQGGGQSQGGYNNNNGGYNNNGGGFNDSAPQSGYNTGAPAQNNGPAPIDELEDDIPF